MIEKQLSDVGAGDLDALISAQAHEGRTIEYKSALPGGKDDDKREFLADASSFANTIGGDLLYGVAETGGVPTKITGLGETNLDAERQRLDSILATGLDPRIRHLTHIVDHPNGKVLLLRIDASWIGPHRVVFRGHDKFYARNSTGKYPLDVTELRDAFLRTSAAGERIREFRDTRLLEVAADRTPVPLSTGTRILVHLIPLQAFITRQQLNVSKYYHAAHAFRPMGQSGWTQRINVDGVVTYDGGMSPFRQYTQLFRHGVIEAADAFLANNPRAPKQLSSAVFEERILASVGEYLKILRDLGVAPPVYAFISMIGAKGITLYVSDFVAVMSERQEVDRDALILPEVTFLSFDDDVAQTLKPAFDMVWNAFGFEGSRNYDATGRRKKG